MSQVVGCSVHVVFVLVLVEITISVVVLMTEIVVGYVTFTVLIRVVTGTTEQLSELSVSVHCDKHFVEFRPQL